MTKIKQLGVVVATLVAGTMTSVAQPKAPNTAELAERIVTKTTGVKKGDIVQINGGTADMAFMEDLAVAVRKKGAFPLVTVWSESGEKKLMDGVPAEFDTQTNAAELALAKTVNVVISIPAVRDASIYEKFPADRQRKLATAGQVIGQTLLKRNVRQIELGNGLAPSPSRAKTLGVSEADLSTLYWAGLSADYAAVEDKAKTLKDALAKGGELQIKLANGTDLKMKIKGRKVLTSDGVISADDVKAGGAQLQAWLPAGEVFLAPVPGSAEGKIVDDRMVFLDKEILGVTAEVKAGKITNITAKSGWEIVKPRYDVAGPGKNDIGLFDIGINPNVKSTGKLENYVSAGTITIGSGNNLWAGGTNKEPFGLQFQLTGATVLLDGKPIIENGVLK
ncbi:MAG: aminopeptidase [Deltaproteobacteria bacterium]|nr:aminopeptidase [Deltaproteobacteria bacterium]